MRFWFTNGAWASKSAQQRIRELEPEKVKSIAIIRHAALGDMVLSRPFIYECRQFFPNAKITLSLVSNYTRGAPEDMVDRVHIAIGSDQRHISKKQQYKVAKELGHHDLLFDLAVTSRSLWLTKLNSAKLKFGFPYHAFQKYLFYDVTVPRSDLRFEAESMTDLLNVIGHKTSIPLNFALPEIPNKSERAYVVYFTSASTQYKCWPDDCFIELIDALSKQYPDMDHYVLEGMGGEESVQNIMNPFKNTSNVSSKQINDIDETFAFVRAASLVVSNDTGIRHLAIAGEVPSIGLFSVVDGFGTAPFRYWPRFGRHEVAYSPDGSWPNVDMVKRMATRLLSS